QLGTVVMGVLLAIFRRSATRRSLAWPARKRDASFFRPVPFWLGVGDNSLISLYFREENGFGLPSVQLGFPSAWAWNPFSPVWISFSSAWNSFRAGWEGRPRRVTPSSPGRSCRSRLGAWSRSLQEIGSQAGGG